MKSNKEVGGLLPSRKLASVPQRVFNPVTSVLNRTFALLVPRDWSSQTLERILNDTEHSKELLEMFIKSELTKMNTTGVTVCPYYMAVETSNQANRDPGCPYCWCNLRLF